MDLDEIEHVRFLNQTPAPRAVRSLKTCRLVLARMECLSVVRSEGREAPFVVEALAQRDP